MTEPVAYLNKYIDNSTNITRYKTKNPRLLSSNPLYTAEQLHPHVKMTRAEFDEFKKLLSVGISTIYEAFDVIDSDRGEMDEFEHLYNRLFTNTVNEQAKNQIEFSKLWDSLSTWSVEETIEIVPNMKWFVRSKKPDSDGDWQFLNGIDEPNDWGYSHNEEDTNNPRNIAYPFDTKERAEEWKNPITEVVLLPIGDK